jgi:hypothetical protein
MESESDLIFIFSHISLFSLSDKVVVSNPYVVIAYTVNPSESRIKNIIHIVIINFLYIFLHLPFHYSNIYISHNIKNI